LIFFDGEEAFRAWTSTDSIYGARHLAEKWEGQTYTSNRVDGNYLDRIDMFVLLDLLGAKDPVIFSTDKSTEVR
jgi:glutaminyl-peptide cyclotransferase